MHGRRAQGLDGLDAQDRAVNTQTYTCLQGGLFAREGNAREEARLRFRPHNPLYPNSEWTLNLPSETRIQAITAGRSFVAAVTSDRQLHMFTTAGKHLSHAPLLCHLCLASFVMLSIVDA